MRYILVTFMDLQKEEQLVLKAQTDPKAFGILYDRYYPQIFKYILRRVTDIESAQDITSQTFFKALKNITKFQWQNIPFSSWLYRISSSEIANFFRLGKRSISLDTLMNETGWEPEDEHRLETELIEAEEKLKRHKKFLAVQQLVASLDSKYQEVIALRFFEKKKLGQIAQILDKKEGTVKSLLNRALNKLRYLFEVRPIEEKSKDMQPFGVNSVLQVEEI